MQTTDANAELLRLYYLQQLGITSYVPRNFLPGALVVTADPAVEPQQRVAPEAEVVVKPAIVFEAEPVISSPAITRNVFVDEPRPAPPAREVDAAPPRSAEQEMAPFQILFVVVSPVLAIAVQIPAAMKPVLRESDTRLLGNVLRWLGLAWPSQAVPLHFRWPLPGLPDTGAEQAGKGLQVFLEQAALEQPFKQLLVFGGEPASALRSGGGGQCNTWQAWYTHSLAELLAVPALKHETWQTLLPLRVQLLS